MTKTVNKNILGKEHRDWWLRKNYLSEVVKEQPSERKTSKERPEQSEGTNCIQVSGGRAFHSDRLFRVKILK